MNLKEALDLAFVSNDKWRVGNGRETAEINSRHVRRILGDDFQIEDTSSATFAKITRVLQMEEYAPSTINKITSVLSKLLTELAQTGYSVPIVKFKRQSVKQGRHKFYKEEEMEKILNATRRREDFLLLHDSIEFALKTGCRQGEMLALTTDKVDIVRREVLFVDTKNGSDHWLPLHSALVPILERRLEQCIDERIFPWDSAGQLRNAFYKSMDLAGLEKGRAWHTIRHTTATWMVDRGVPLRAIMGVLNHSNVATTLRYAKASDKAVSSAIDAL
jgi:integrase|tara:strand:- start:558 stop:1382 length:825 start_codon:yes stop_codon:yes gene_type:complete